MKKSKKQEVAEKYLNLVPETYAKTPQEKGYSECHCTKNAVFKDNVDYALLIMQERKNCRGAKGEKS